MCWYYRAEISRSTSSLYGCSVRSHHYLRLRRPDALHTTMEQAYYGFDLRLEELSPLPMVYNEPPSSCLDHLAAPLMHLDTEPFLNTLRQVYRDEFSTAVAVAVCRYRDQILELEQDFPPQVETSLQGNTLCFVDSTP